MSLQQSNTPEGYIDEDDDVRMELYREYADQVFEDFESFCDRMADKYGQNWVSILPR